MKKILLLLLLILCNMTYSCTRHARSNTTAVRISDRYYAGGIIGLGEYATTGEKERKNWRRYYYTRYLITSNSNSVEARILNRAVSYTLQSSYHEAGVLLRQIEGDLLPAALNNLAILNEINGNHDKARNNYHRALSLEKDNRLIKQNLNSMRY